MMGEVGLALRAGGGVIDDARGLLYTDAAGELAAGDDGSLAPGIGPNRCRILSSSDGLLDSTSLSKEDRNDGAPAVERENIPFDVDVELPPPAWFDGVATVGLDDEASPAWIGSRLVRGRLSFRSGSCS